jgi:citrate synthase
MFTVMFALGRLPGWIGQWKELMDDPTRPFHIDTGETGRFHQSSFCALQ